MENVMKNYFTFSMEAAKLRPAEYAELIEKIRPALTEEEVNAIHVIVGYLHMNVTNADLGKAVKRALAMELYREFNAGK